MRRGVLRHGWFSAFIAAVGLGSVGSEVSRLAMPLLVLDLTGSLGAAALLRVLQAVPYVLFGALAGVLIDRVDKRRLLIGCDLARAGLTALIPLSVATGTFSLVLLYAVAFLLGAVEVVWGVTADFSVVPSLV
ncbi:MAG: MFS transporter, partial [Candidatus Limnocylindria bacterium]